MNWFHQVKNYGLGNFIMATPALKMLSDKQGESVKVYFDTPSLAELYSECPFISILKKKPSSKPFHTSAKPPRNKRKKESDSNAYCRIILGTTDYQIADTYIDKVKTIDLEKRPDKKYIGVFHGCLGLKPVRIQEKDIGVKTRQYMVDAVKKAGYIPVILGNQSDRKLFWKKCDLKGCLNYLGQLSLKDSISILSQCDYFMSNDTGLYHAASALKIEGLVIWRKTNLNKNRAVFKGVTHFQNLAANLNKDKDSIDNFLQGINENSI